MKFTLAVLFIFLFSKLGCSQNNTFSSNLPIVIINTSGATIVNDPKIAATMGIIAHNNGAINNTTDSFNHFFGKIGIELRGQSSQSFPMKSYGIELWNDANQSIEKSILNMPAESDWILYAPYTDKTLMRNVLAYSMSRDMGNWAANCRYVELIVNGDYKGVYVLMEKIKRNSERVNISKLTTSDNTGDALTGGYIFSIDKEANGWASNYAPPNATSGQSIYYGFVYPKITSITNQQQAYLKTYVDSFETALKSADFQDKNTGWRRYANETSFIDYLLVNEVSRNVDGYRLSTYLYKDKNSKGGKITAGPVWDYDLAFRNADYCRGSDVTGWGYRFNETCPADFWQVPFWWKQFENDTAFQQKLTCRWKELRLTVLSDSFFNKRIDSIVTLTSSARERHFSRWPILGQYVWPNPQPIARTYTDEIIYLKDWLHNRLNWLDQNIKKGVCGNAPVTSTINTQVTVSPNPGHSQVKILIATTQATTCNMRIVDINGRVINKHSLSIPTGLSMLNIDVQPWTTGMYILNWETSGGESGSQKLVKQ